MLTLLQDAELAQCLAAGDYTGCRDVLEAIVKVGLSASCFRHDEIFCLEV